MSLVSSIRNKMWVYIPREKLYWYLLSEFRAIQFWFLFITHLSLITYIVKSDRYFRQASHIRSLWSVNRFQDLPISDRDGLRIFHIDIESRWLPSGPQPFPLQRIVNPDEINPHDHQGSRRFRPRCEEIEQVFMILFFCGGWRSLCALDFTLGDLRYYFYRESQRIDHVTSRARYSSANVVVIQRD